MVTIEETKHLGDVYLNGMSFYEVSSYDKLLDLPMRTEVMDHWTEKIVPVHNPEQTKYVWYAEVDNENTTIFANFQGANPNEEYVEINVRRSCFYPTETGIDYITVRGFEMAHATPWSLLQLISQVDRSQLEQGLDYETTLSMMQNAVLSVSVRKFPQDITIVLSARTSPDTYISWNLYLVL